MKRKSFMVGLIMIFATALLFVASFLVVSSVRAEDNIVASVSVSQPESDFQRLIVGVWEWNGVIDDEQVKVVHRYSPDGTMRFLAMNSYTVYTNEEIDGYPWTLPITYKIRDNKLWLHFGDKWGLSKIIQLDANKLALVEITDFMDFGDGNINRVIRSKPAMTLNRLE